MARTGSAITVLAALLVPTLALAADVEFYMAADRTKAGTEDLIRIEIIVGNAPEGSLIQYPAPNDFETVSTSKSSQTSMSIGPNGNMNVRSVVKHTLMMRANRTGKLVIPAAGLQTPSKLYKTESIAVEVVKGRLAPDRPPAPQVDPNDPFAALRQMMPQLEEDPLDDPFQAPANDSDVFVRAVVDKSTVYVGEQLTYSVWVYTRVDLSSANGIDKPKFDGFIAKDAHVARNFAWEQKSVNGVPYRAARLTDYALFPLRAGEFTIEPSNFELGSVYPFPGRPMKRATKELKITVKPVPGGRATNVGQWRLSTEVTQTEVALGEPVQLKLIVEGRGDLSALEVPKPEVPVGLRLFDPTITDKPANRDGHLGGTRIVEYVMVPQQTGSFTIPGVTFETFDPDLGKMGSTKSQDVTINVKAANGAVNVPAQGTQAPAAPKNELVATGLKPLRHTARFSGSAGAPLWSTPAFIPLTLAPFILFAALGLFGFARNAFGGDDAASRNKKQARAARKRLAQAEELLTKGSTQAFYVEVDKALRSFLEAKLTTPVSGLTRPQLDELLKSRSVADDVRQRVLAVFETCDIGRYAPGMGEAAARRKAIDDAAHAMEVWP